MNALAGTGGLIRLILRRDRVGLAIWILLLAVIPISFASSYQQLYPTAEAQRTFAKEINNSPSEIAMLGAVYSPTVGGLTAWRWSTAAILLIGVASLITVIRHTRAEEDAGRRELLGATVVGRAAPLTAALLVTFSADLWVGLIAAAGLIGLGLPTAGSIALGLSAALAGWLFAALAGAIAQLTQSAAAARGITGAGLGLFYLLRIAGDIGAKNGFGWLTWLSPFGWMRSIRPFAGERIWIFGIFVAAVVLLVGIAYTLSARRDLGAGLLAERLGPADGGPGLSGPFGLAWRLQRGSLVAWVAGFALIGAVFGWVARTATDQLITNPQARAYFSRLGGGADPSDGFFTLALMVFIDVIAIYAIMAVLRLRVEEVSQRAEPLLATSSSRVQWALSHLVFGLLGPLLILGGFGLTAGLTYGAAAGNATQELTRVLAASLAYVPAVWVLAGLAMALFGLFPRLTTLGWAALGGCVLIDLAGEMRRVGQAVLDLSPFTHVPKLLAGQPSLFPLVGLAAAAALLMAIGLAGFARRDVG